MISDRPMMARWTFAGLMMGLLTGVTGCQDASSSEENGIAVDGSPFSAIGAAEEVKFTGTEPFWGGAATGNSLIYTTPELPDGQTIKVERFAGNNGLGLSGTLAGQSFDMAITPGECSDQMSERRYPFTVTLRIADETRNGCAWTAGMPFDRPQSP